MERQIGIRVYDRHSALLSTLWQHLDEREILLNLDSDEDLSATLSDWSGDWEPARPDLSRADTYDITERAAQGQA